MEPIIGAGAGSGPGQAGQPPGDLIKDGDTANFARDVIDQSMNQPVIVDFWATWCGPCKNLGPLLEKTVTEARGAVRLVKINVDENQELAAQMRVQSIPAVFAFSQGRPVDGFVGEQSASQIKQFVERLTQSAGIAQGPSPVDQALEQAKAALEAGQPGAASALYGQILQQEPDNPAAIAGMIRCSLDSGDVTAARQMFDGLSEDLQKGPEVASVGVALELAEQGSSVGPIPELVQKVAANEKDFQARFDLAMAYFGQDQRQEAVDQLLEILRRKRGWNEEAARKQLLKFFEAWGPTDPLTVETRRQLSSLLFS